MEEIYLGLLGSRGLLDGLFGLLDDDGVEANVARVPAAVTAMYVALLARHRPAGLHSRLLHVEVLTEQPDRKLVPSMKYIHIIAVSLRIGVCNE